MLAQPAAAALNLFAPNFSPLRPPPKRIRQTLAFSMHVGKG